MILSKERSRLLLQIFQLLLVGYNRKQNHAVRPACFKLSMLYMDESDLSILEIFWGWVLLVDMLRERPAGDIN